MARRIGKAWGNALGGYRLQNRVGGKFSSGFGGGSKGSRAATVAKRASTPAQRRAQYLDGRRVAEGKAKRNKKIKNVAKAAAVVGVVGAAGYAAHKSGAISGGNRDGVASVKVKLGKKSGSAAVDYGFVKSARAGGNFTVYAGQKNKEFRVPSVDAKMAARKNRKADATRPKSWIPDDFRQSGTANPSPATKSKNRRSYGEDILKGVAMTSAVAKSASDIQKGVRAISGPKKTDEHGIGERNQLAQSPVIARSQGLEKALLMRSVIQPGHDGAITSEFRHASGSLPPRRQTLSRNDAVVANQKKRSSGGPNPIDWSGEKVQENTYDGGPSAPYEHISNSRSMKHQDAEIRAMRVGRGPISSPRQGSSGRVVSLSAAEVRSGTPQGKRHKLDTPSKYAGVVDFKPDNRIISIDTSALKGDQEDISRAMRVNQMHMTKEEFYTSERRDRLLSEKKKKSLAANKPKARQKHESRHSKGIGVGQSPRDPNFVSGNFNGQAAYARELSREAGHYRLSGIVPGDVNLKAGIGATQKPLDPKRPLGKDAVRLWENILKEAGMPSDLDQRGPTYTQKAGKINTIPFGLDEEELWKVQRR